MINKIRKKSLSILDKSKTISEVLFMNSKSIPRKTFIIDYTSKKSKKITYFQFNDYVDSCCKYFKKCNLKKGDIISLILENSVCYLIIYFASIRYGTILNPLPTTLGFKSLEEKLNKVKPKKIFVNIEFESKKFKKIISRIDTNNFDTFINLIEKEQNLKISIYSPQKKDISILYYSSGTTGKSKIIEYSNEAIIENQRGLILSGLLCEKNIHLCFLPLFHTASLRYTIKFNLCVGGTIILFKNFWSLKDKIWQIINKYKINYFQTVPTILNVILNTNYKNYRRPKSMNYIGSGSAILPIYMLKNFENKYKIKISNLYGLSEIGCSHFENPYLKNKKSGSIGKILHGFKYKIFVDKDLSKNQYKIGELGINSKTLLSNYYKNYNLFKKSFKQGFFLTGDYVKVNKNGNFFYIDRKKDLIIKGGVNILPSEIESVIQKIKSVKEVAITRCFDQFYEENVCCFLVLKKNFKLNLKKIESYCEKFLGNFKKPQKYVILKKLPKGPSGKILKLELKKMINEKNQI